MCIRGLPLNLLSAHSNLQNLNYFLLVDLAFSSNTSSDSLLFATWYCKLFNFWAKFGQAYFIGKHKETHVVFLVMSDTSQQVSVIFLFVLVFSFLVRLVVVMMIYMMLEDTFWCIKEKNFLIKNILCSYNTYKDTKDDLKIITKPFPRTKRYSNL